jgi:hypothetical protein
VKLVHRSQQDTLLTKRWCLLPVFHPAPTQQPIQSTHRRYGASLRGGRAVEKTVAENPCQRSWAPEVSSPGPSRSARIRIAAHFDFQRYLSAMTRTRGSDSSNFLPCCCLLHRARHRTEEEGWSLNILQSLLARTASCSVSASTTVISATYDRTGADRPGPVSVVTASTPLWRSSLGRVKEHERPALLYPRLAARHRVPAMEAKRTRRQGDPQPHEQ